MALPSVLSYATASAALAHTTLRPLGFYDVVLPKAIQRVLETSAWVHLLKLLYRRQLGKAIALASLTVRFQLVNGDRVTTATHILRLLQFRRIGLQLPPMLSSVWFLQMLSEHGFWQRHKTEQLNRDLCGPIYSIQPPLGQLTIFVSAPELVEQVLCDKVTYPSRGHTGFGDKDVVEEGLLALPTGPKWAHHRKIISRFMATSYLDRFSAVVTEETKITLGKWERCAATGTRLNLHYDMSMLTLDIILRCGFDVDESERRQLIPEEENVEAKDLDFALKEIVLRTVSPLYRFIPNPSKRAQLEEGKKRGEASRDRIFRASMARVQSGQGSEAKTMLSALIEAKNEDGTRALSDKEVLHELSTMRGAGHETTSNTLCWTMLLLSKHPEPMRKLQAEVDAKVCGDVPTFTECRELAYTNQVIFEALRLFPTVPSFPRAVAKDTKLGGYDVPCGSRVFVSQGALNSDGSVWDEPCAFRPERFDDPPQLAPSQPVGVPGGHRFGFVPFGAGPRTCIGQRFAMMEAVQILAALVKRFDITLDDPQAVVSEIAEITLGPKDGLWLQVQERHFQ